MIERRLDEDEQSRDPDGRPAAEEDLEVVGVEMVQPLWQLLPLVLRMFLTVNRLVSRLGILVLAAHGLNRLL